MILHPLLCSLFCTDAECFSIPGGAWIYTANEMSQTMFPVRKLLSTSAENDAAQGVSGHRDREAAVSDEIPSQ